MEEHEHNLDEGLEREINSVLVFWIKVVLGVLTVVFGWIGYCMLVGV